MASSGTIDKSEKMGLVKLYLSDKSIYKLQSDLFVYNKCLREYHSNRHCTMICDRGQREWSMNKADFTKFSL